MSDDRIRFIFWTLMRTPTQPIHPFWRSRILIATTNPRTAFHHHEPRSPTTHQSLYREPL